MPLIEVSEKALIKLCAWMNRNGLEDFSDAILALLGEDLENRIEIIPAPRVFKVDRDQARKELVMIGRGDGDDDND